MKISLQFSQNFLRMNVEASLAVYEHDQVPVWSYAPATQELVDFEAQGLLYGADFRRDGSEDLVDGVAFNVGGLRDISKILEQLPTPLRRRVVEVVITP